MEDLWQAPPWPTTSRLARGPKTAGVIMETATAQVVLDEFEARQECVDAHAGREGELEGGGTFMFYTCIMFGFDSLAGGVVVVVVVVSIAEFGKDFGRAYAGDYYVVDANWQSIGIPSRNPLRHRLGRFRFMTGFGVNRFIIRTTALHRCFVAYIYGQHGRHFSCNSSPRPPAHFFGGKLLTGIYRFRWVALLPSRRRMRLKWRRSLFEAPLRRASINFAMVVVGQLIGYGVIDARNQFLHGQHDIITGSSSPRSGDTSLSVSWCCPFFPRPTGSTEKPRDNMAKLHDVDYVRRRRASWPRFTIRSRASMNDDKESQGSVGECLSKKADG
ncbi:hypothetical protein K504DRAFT_531721 [Pleomassaria siparia CBS 279.74]|uniref:Uncharacterized protein n=1 Tax=Pleomassaria siparia CBS 279.74 TaxID=1314801 RepID=A0A6G1KJT9_9PLEO|nr:hypothetical protein K504DRAFT_531721 [Pleomassaria siparia CBS 279.74]